MPTYVYVCRTCGEQAEVSVSPEEKKNGLNVICKKCGGVMSQLFGNVFVPGARSGGGVPPCCGQ